jgi:tetratricopeptide (TPR) repeat protein
MVAGEPDPIERAGLRFQVGLAEEALAVDPTDIEALRYLAHAYSLLGRIEEGLRADRRLVELLPGDPRVRYNLACSCALSDLHDEAIERLEEAVGLGFADLELMRRDADLDALRVDPRFLAIEERLAGKRRD